MKLKSIEPDIDPNQPFGVHGSNGRLRLAELMINIFENVSEPTTIILDARWGEGKTHFLSRLRPLLKTNEISSIYFDAFKYDYYEDPLIPLSGEIAEHLRNNSSDEKALSDFVSSASNLIKNVGPNFAARLVKVVTAGAVEATDIEVLTKIGDALGDTAEETTEKLLNKEISNFTAKKAIVNEFRTRLTQAAKALSVEKEDSTPSPKNARPLIILIDELDRTKPTFALALLERIKHFFDVPSVHFLIAVDTEQLESSIRGVYGEGINARTYLEKFYSLLLQFPKNEQDGNDELFRAVAERQIKAVGVSAENERCIANASIYLSALAGANNWGFRTLQKVSTHVGLCLCNSAGFQSIEIPVLCGLWALKITNGSLYDKIRRGELIGDEIDHSLNIVLLRHELSERMASVFINVWKTLAGKSNISDQDKKKVIYDLDINDLRVFLKRFCSENIDGISDFTVNR